MNYLFLQAYAIFIGILASGASYGMTFFAVPPLLKTYFLANKAAQLKIVWHLGQKCFPLTFISTGLIHFWLSAYGNTASTFEVIAGVFTIGIAPFSIIFIRPADLALLSFAETTEKDVESAANDMSENTEYDVLAWRWAMLNAVRATMPLVGAIISAYGLLSMEVVGR